MTLVLEISPKCGQGGGGPKSRKLCRRHGRGRPLRTAPYSTAYLHHEAGVGALRHHGGAARRVAGLGAHPGSGAARRADAGHALLVEVTRAPLLLQLQVLRGDEDVPMSQVILLMHYVICTEWHKKPRSRQGKTAPIMRHSIFRG